MKRVRFTGRGRLAVYGFELRNGDSAVMSDQEAAALNANPRIAVTVTDHPLEPEAGDGAGQHIDQQEKE